MTVLSCCRSLPVGVIALLPDGDERRYVRSLLDVAHAHRGPHAPVPIDRDVLARADQARWQLPARSPEFARAVPVVMPTWY